MVAAKSLPARDHHFAENVLTDLIDNANADAGRDPAGNSIDKDLADRQRNGNRDPEYDPILMELGGNRTDQGGLSLLDDQSHSDAEQTQNNVKEDAESVPLHVMPQPYPFSHDLGQAGKEPF
jgi:hypothetical protein